MRTLKEDSYDIYVVLKCMEKYFFDKPNLGIGQHTKNDKRYFQIRKYYIKYVVRG